MNGTLTKLPGNAELPCDCCRKITNVGIKLNYAEPNVMGEENAGYLLKTEWKCWSCYSNNRSQQYKTKPFFTDGYELEEQAGFEDEVDRMLDKHLPSDYEYCDFLFGVGK